jgi:hypothetical protein
MLKLYPLIVLVHSLPLLMLHPLLPAAKFHEVSLMAVSSTVSNGCCPFYTQTRIGESSLRKPNLVDPIHHMTQVSSSLVVAWP